MSGAPRDLPTGRVALLFSDIQGSTAMLTRLGEAYGDVLDAHDEIMRAAFARHGGHEFSNEGDAFGAAFADARAAVAAAREIQQQIAARPWPGGEQVRVRMGLHLGEPKIRGDDYWGEDVHFAARVCSAAHGGQVVLSAALRATLADDEVVSLGHHGLKDFPTPRELFQLVLGGAPPERFPAPRTLSRFRSNLPSVTTPIIGREEVVADLAALLGGGQRLVTLTGAGGMGKTRVAVALGERVAEEFPDGVAFVPLAPAERAGVTAAIADATGAPRGGDAEVAVLEHLERLRLLVILDNCEHVVDAAADAVAAILARCPRVAVLATAQLPLDLAAETIYRLPPLSDGAEMFVDRARAHDHAFCPDEEDLALVSRTCSLLEGFPLAIELAAARVRLLGLPRLVSALEHGLDALGRGGRDLAERHRTLRAALDWTVSLLSPGEREVFAALGAFATAWSLEQAEQLLAADHDEVGVWEAMTRLMDASLVVVRGDGRFAMPQRVRQHAAELLAASPNGARHRRAHAELVGRELRELAIDVFVDYRRQLANVVDLLPEARRAIAWAREEPQSTYRHVVALMAPALARTGNLRLVADDVELFPDDGSEPRDWDEAALSYARGLVHAMRWSTDTDDELAQFDRAARGFEHHGDPREALLARYMSQAALGFGGRHAEVAARAADVLEAAARIGDPRWTAEAERAHLSDLEPSRFAAAAEELVARHGVGAGAFSIQYADMHGQAAAARGDEPGAAAWYAQALREHPREQLYLVLNSVKGVAALLGRVGQDAACTELRAAVDAAYRARTGSDHGDLDPGWTEVYRAAEERLGPVGLAEARARGAELSYDELVDRALQLALEQASAGVEERA